jgi:integrase
MTRRRKEVGIRRKRNGWQAFIDVDGTFRSKQFAIDTPVDEMRAWRDAQAKTATVPPNAGSFAADVAAYLRRPEIAAMPTVDERTRHLELWLTALGRDRSRQSITRDEVEAELQRLLASGLAQPTVYHRRTALGSFFTVMNGRTQTHNPVTGTTRPDHYRPVDRSVPFATLERILAAMPDERRIAPGIRRPSFAKLRVAVILHTGIPPAELLKLHRHHFDRQAAIVRMPWRDKGAGTPAHTRELSPDGVAAFVALDAAGAWGAFAPERLSMSFKRAARAVCGADTPIRLYDLRHSLGTDTYARTHDLATVGRVLGHVEGSIVTHRYAMGAHAEVDRAAMANVHAYRTAQVTAARAADAAPVVPAGAPRLRKRRSLPAQSARIREVI